MKIGYWAFKGKGEFVKTLATFLELPFEEVDYYSNEEWLSDQAKYEFDFPSLPYLIDGEIKICDNSAIYIYLINKAERQELGGRNPLDIAHVRMIICALEECFATVIGTAVSGVHAKKKVARLGEEGPVLQKYKDADTFLGDKEWFLGEITLADIIGAGLMNVTDLLIRSSGGNSLFIKCQNLSRIVNKIFSQMHIIRDRIDTDSWRQRPTFTPGSLPFELLPK